MDNELRILRQDSINAAKDAIRESVGKDNLIMQAISSIDDIKNVANKLCGRLRHWYELYLPEASRAFQDNERFVATILLKDKATLKAELGIGNTMGAEIAPEDVDAIMKLAQEISSLYSLIEDQEKYIEDAMKRLCPNIEKIAGSLIGAKLIEHAGGLRGLINMPSSTIQLLGAEKALFRHIKTGARCPKYGLILQHQLVSNAKDKAKAARMLADKISMAAKIDFFHGDYAGDRLLEELKKKISAIR